MIFIPSNKPPEKNKAVKYLEAAGIPYVCFVKSQGLEH
jgi:hypothetical protein